MLVNHSSRPFPCLPFLQLITRSLSLFFPAIHRWLAHWPWRKMASKHATGRCPPRARKERKEWWQCQTSFVTPSRSHPLEPLPSLHPCTRWTPTWPLWEVKVWEGDIITRRWEVVSEEVFTTTSTHLCSRLTLPPLFNLPPFPPHSSRPPSLPPTVTCPHFRQEAWICLPATWSGLWLEGCRLTCDIW